MNHNHNYNQNRPRHHQRRSDSSPGRYSNVEEIDEDRYGNSINYEDKKAMIVNEIRDFLVAYLPNLDQEKLFKLAKYLGLMKKWNRVYNLTSITTSKAMVLRHIMDSLSIAPYLKGENVIDVGTGAGLPGIPLSILEEERTFFLLDSNNKKIRFLQQAKMELELDNVVIVNSRVESYIPPVCFDTIVARAFSSLNEFLLATQHLVCDDGLFVAMKGVYPLSEIETLHSSFVLEKVEPLEVKDLNAERHAVVIRKK